MPRVVRASWRGGFQGLGFRLLISTRKDLKTLGGGGVQGFRGYECLEASGLKFEGGVSFWITYLWLVGNGGMGYNY